jgi:hypothetical protein
MRAFSGQDSGYTPKFGRRREDGMSEVAAQVLYMGVRVGGLVAWADNEDKCV